MDNKFNSETKTNIDYIFWNPNRFPMNPKISFDYQQWFLMSYRLMDFYPKLNRREYPTYPQIIQSFRNYSNLLNKCIKFTRFQSRPQFDGDYNLINWSRSSIIWPELLELPEVSGRGSTWVEILKEVISCKNFIWIDFTNKWKIESKFSQDLNKGKCFGKHKSFDKNFSKSNKMCQIMINNM